MLLDGRVVAAVFALSFALWLYIIFGTFGRLTFYSDGLAPFDARFFGYSPEQARALLEALGADGRAYYQNVQLAVDSVYPVSYGLSRMLLLFFLTRPGRAAARGLAAPATAALL